MGTIVDPVTSDSGVGELQNGVLYSSSSKGDKLIIDTDPGIGDFLSPLPDF